MSVARRQALKALAAQRQGALVPGAFNALSARIVAEQGFPALYLTGAGLSNMALGLPDLGFIGLAEVAEHTARIRDAVDLPLIVDADTGFGNALNVRHTVRVLERAGADAVQIEDQVAPKRCGHFEGKAVVDTEEAVSRIRAAVDARHDSGLLIVARTDAAATLGFEAAVERAQRFAEAGADVLFVEALTGLDQMQRLPTLLPQPLLMNLVVGGRTPPVPAPQLAAWGYSFVLYANAALQGACLGMQRALGALREHGVLHEDPSLLLPFEARQRLVDKPAWDALEARYAAAAPAAGS
ncbi:MAG: isocitrate lyase/phosphoenolpyruvate mutase family protein [Hydrogenophaga sp.]|uniref:isocitrate lyase/PEP mutase family protein n=1 Tax=Hydrogenophaga sp. TaxID=1904254 RepID=UPI00257E2C10|nr:isocitrate lyase/phosphoenolpyruvate mutase family protein [Hydrogenophaga sp.]MBL0944702.1 isocitrate lyase/phosphoenolpyruvate mutase family protein [Hydrogenophaga sp.]